MSFLYMMCGRLIGPRPCAIASVACPLEARSKTLPRERRDERSVVERGASPPSDPATAHRAGPGYFSHGGRHAFGWRRSRFFHSFHPGSALPGSSGSVGGSKRHRS